MARDALWWGYFGVEAKPAMSAGHVQILVSGLRNLGSQNHPQPAKRNWGPRIRNDGRAAIFEAEFLKENLSVQWFVDNLAALYGVAPGSIVTSVVQAGWGGESTPVVSFLLNGEKYLVMVAFGGVNVTHEQSGAAARGYLAANIGDWETAVVE